MRLAIRILLLALVLQPACRALEVRYRDNGKIDFVTIRLKVIAIDSQPDGTTEITAAGRESDQDISVRLILGPETPWRTETASRNWLRRWFPRKVTSYRFPVFFRPAGSNPRALDDLVARYFPVGPDGTIVRETDYAGTSTTPRKRWRMETTHIDLVDPVGPMAWSIRLRLDTAEGGMLTLTVGEMRYG